MRRPRPFWDLVDTSGGPSACWPWLGRCDPDGYGVYDAGGKAHRAHRLALEEKLGHQLTPDEVTRHARDCVRSCCNGAHLTPGTIADNNRDLVDHGRYAHKLEPSDVAAIRLAVKAGGWGIFSRVARQFGVTPQYVGRLARQVGAA